MAARPSRETTKVFHSWLDRWDEWRAKQGNEVKEPTSYELDAERAFPGAGSLSGVDDFCALSELAMADRSFYDPPNGDRGDFLRKNEWLTFSSDLSTDIEVNNQVWVKITEGKPRDRAVVVFHHWNARKWNSPLARFLAKRGFTVAEICMPYHFQRSRPGSLYADYMLSANLGRTLQSVRQSVWDGRKLISWLKSDGFGEISVLGLSLGSWSAGLVAAHDGAVSKAALFLTGESLADMVWTGRATEAIRASLAPKIGLCEFRRAWAPLDLGNYAGSLARRELDLLLVLAKRDRVVLPEFARQFIHQLRDAGARPSVRELNCGHYSLALPPYNLLAGASLYRFLNPRI
ncbi:dienelactone hydrolase-related enzyme [uncultured Paracoccus sp.]|uniref:RcgR family putative quorum lactone hydrolase n=1 Tax=uncultured Paracoccus sp. TaxID=189685 RepID=UPI002602C47F|nr:dienelactone hydrolase-related enzyme [uncultured Paracoccus sp.]